jgi:hypothetical protein
MVDNSDNSTHMVDNSDNSNHSVNGSNNRTSADVWTVSLSNQDLTSSVTGSSIYMGGNRQSGSVNTGAVSYSGSAFANFSGVQTVSNNTGIGSAAQAATSLAANANIAFGH